MSLQRSDLIASGLLVAAALVGVVFWESLPAEMAIHFDAGGTPNSYVSKPVGVMLAPAIGLASIAFTRVAVRVDPASDPVIENAAIYFLGGVVSYVHLLVIAYNLDYQFSMTAAIGPVLVAAAALAAWAIYRDRIA